MTFNMPSKSEYENTLVLFKDFLRSFVPKATASVGSVLYEWIIRPLSICFKSAENALDESATTYTMKYLAISENTDTGTADNILSNYFIYRNSGSSAHGVLRIQSSTPITRIPSGSIFTVSDVSLVTSVTFYGVYENIDSYTSTDSVLYVEASKINGSYYFNIDVSTSEPSDTVIPENTEVTIMSYVAGVTSAVLSSALEGGSTGETDAQMVTRAVTSMTSITGGGASIQKILSGSGYTVYSSASFCAGDPEMIRDSYNPVFISLGGKIDTYVKTAQYPNTGTISVEFTRFPGTDIWEADVTSQAAPGFIGISSIICDYTIDTYSISFGSTDDTIPAEGARLSCKQTAVVAVELSSSETIPDSVVISLSYQYMPYIQELQDYMDRSDVRILGMDVLIKAAVPVVLSMSSECVYTDSAYSDISICFQDFVQNMAAGVVTFNMSDAQEYIGSNFAGTYLRSPIQLHAYTYKYDGVTLLTYDSNNGLLDISGLNDTGMTGRVRFYAISTENIILNDLTQ